MNQQPLSDHDLCAFADGRLDAAAGARVAARVDADPRLAARVKDWQAQDAALRRAFDAVCEEAVPARLIDVARGHRVEAAARSRAPLRWAAAVGWLVLGAIVGYGVRDYSDTVDARDFASLPRQAAIAHAVYVPEVRHPVEVGAEQQDHLVAWLTKRLGTSVHAPSLDTLGFTLVGGRLLPSTQGPGAQLMYQDASGQRLTLYLSRDTGETSTAFRYAREADVGVFYWVDGGTGYALSADLERERLLTIANVVYAQLNP